jgi:hypothetical protein
MSNGPNYPQSVVTSVIDSLLFSGISVSETNAAQLVVFMLAFYSEPKLTEETFVIDLTKPLVTRVRSFASGNANNRHQVTQW